MKILVLYSDDRGLEQVATMGSESTDQKKMQVFVDAKTRHVFPKGVKRIDLHLSQVEDTAVYINDGVTAELKNFEDDTIARALKLAEERKAAAKLKQDVSAASKKLTDSILHRSNLVSKVAAAKHRRDTAAVQLEANKESKRLQDLVKKETEATAAANSELETADKAVEEAKAAKAALEPKK